MRTMNAREYWTRQRSTAYYITVVGAQRYDIKHPRVPSVVNGMTVGDKFKFSFWIRSSPVDRRCQPAFSETLKAKKYIFFPSSLVNVCMLLRSLKCRKSVISVYGSHVHIIHVATEPININQRSRSRSNWERRTDTHSVLRAANQIITRLKTQQRNCLRKKWQKSASKQSNEIFLSGKFLRWWNKHAVVKANGGGSGDELRNTKNKYSPINYNYCNEPRFKITRKPIDVCHWQEGSQKPKNATGNNTHKPENKQWKSSVRKGFRFFSALCMCD